MSKTLAEQLEEVEAAITDITTNGQEAYTRNKRISRPSLDALLRERRRLEELMAEENGYGVDVAVPTRRG